MESSEESINRQGGKGLAFLPHVGTAAFDGSASQQYFHRDLNHIEGEGPDLGITKCKADHTAQLDAHLWPIFLAHGIVPTVHHELIVDDLPTTYETENFEFRARLTLQGRNCTVLRTLALPGSAPIFDELWIDQGRTSCIQRL